MTITSTIITHPYWCELEPCHATPSDVIHAEHGVRVIPQSDADLRVTVARTQDDELSDYGHQITYQSELLLTVGNQQACLSLSEAMRVGLALVSRAAGAVALDSESERALYDVLWRDRQARMAG